MISACSALQRSGRFKFPSDYAKAAHRRTGRLHFRCGAVLLGGLPNDSPNPPGSRVNRWWYASALAMVYCFYWVFHLLFTQWWFTLPHDQGPGPIIRAERLTNGTMAALLGVTMLAMRSRRVDRAASRGRRAILLAVLVVFLGFHVANWTEHRRAAGVLVEDVGRTTIAADHLLLQGKNPYAAPVDPQGGSPPSTRFDGYKYLPVTMGVYFPSAMLFSNGSQAIVATNLVLSLMAALALGVCVRKEISLDAALLCATLFFMSEVVSYEEVVFGSNDVVPMLLATAALCNLERRFVCGVLVGLAIAAKPLPGVLWIPILLTPRGTKGCAAGIGVGLLPCLPFLLWNPVAMIDNTLLFASSRGWAPAAALYHAPAAVRIAAQLAVIGVYLAVGLRNWSAPASLIRRCCYAAVLSLGLELAAPFVHQNYFIWWYMPLCAAVTGMIFNPATYEWIGRSRSEL